jgi:estrogen-related receptor beta like 1
MVRIVCHVQDEFARISERYREVSGGVTERSRILAQVTEELESVKQEMDERGSSMTDGSKSHKLIISSLQHSKMNILHMFGSSPRGGG